MPRSDGLPEEHPYRDDGCSIAPRCLECPLPRCRYDVAGGARSMLNPVRDAAIAAAYQAGESIEALEQRFKLSRRTVYRVVSQRHAA